LKSRNADGDVPGVVNRQGEYMTVNLSLVVGHIHKIGKRLFAGEGRAVEKYVVCVDGCWVEIGHGHRQFKL